jgi:hypothetical protein
LKIQMFDKDILSDDLIGETLIDLEERFYDERHRIMDGQPIERRKIIQGTNGQEVGHVNLWVEIHPVVNKRDAKGAIKKNQVIWDIESIPKKEYELRVIVWETYDVPNNDPEDMSDIFVKVALNSLDPDLES